MQNSLKIKKKICNIRFRKFSRNLKKFFRKFSQKFSHSHDKILPENYSNFSYSLPRISRKFFTHILSHSSIPHPLKKGEKVYLKVSLLKLSI